MTLKQIFQNLKDLGIVDENGNILPAFEDIVIVKDLKKYEEILQRLAEGPDSSIVPKQPPKLPENAEDIWFKRRKER